MIEPVHRNRPAQRRPSFTLPLPPREARRLARDWSHRRARLAWLANLAWGALAAVLFSALFGLFLYSAFLAPVEWNAADPDYRPGALDAR